MFKKIYICCLAFMLLCFLGCSDELDIKTSAIIFTRSECQRCQEAFEYIEKTLKPDNQSLTFEIKDLSKGENRTLLRKYARIYHIEKGTLPTPIIFTPKGYMSGWENETSPAQLKMLLNIR